jgi:hypothetical protein
MADYHQTDFDSVINVIVVGLILLLLFLIWISVSAGKRATQRLAHTTEVERLRRAAERLRQAGIAVDLAAKSPNAVTPLQLADAQSILAEDMAYRRGKALQTLAKVVAVVGIFCLWLFTRSENRSASDRSSTSLQTASLSAPVSISQGSGTSISPTPFEAHLLKSEFGQKLNDEPTVQGASSPRTTPDRSVSPGWPDGRILTHTEHFVISAIMKVGRNDTLKLRGGPGTRFVVVAEIPPDAKDILAFDKDQIWDGDSWWCPVEWRNQRGYVGRSHLLGVSKY